MAAPASQRDILSDSEVPPELGLSCVIEEEESLTDTDGLDTHIDDGGHVVASPLTPSRGVALSRSPLDTTHDTNLDTTLRPPYSPTVPETGDADVSGAADASLDDMVQGDESNESILFSQFPTPEEGGALDRVVDGGGGGGRIADSDTVEEEAACPPSPRGSSSRGLRIWGSESSAFAPVRGPDTSGGVGQLSDVDAVLWM